MEKIVIGADHGGFKLKERLKIFLQKQGYGVIDIGTYSENSCDYPLVTYAAARAVSQGKVRRGIVICKSGIGNSIVANKLPRVRAALAYTVQAAKLSRRHNDSNMLVLGSLFVNEEKARAVTRAWLKTPFEGGRHLRRLRQIARIERLVRSAKK